MRSRAPQPLGSNSAASLEPVSGTFLSAARLFGTRGLDPSPHGLYEKDPDKDRVNDISWEPFHRNIKCNRLATASKDGSVKVWKFSNQGGVRDMQFSLTGHTGGVQSVKWGGQGYIYTCSQDRSLMVWDADQGIMVRRLEGHGHWVNFMALNCDIVLRTGAFDHKDRTFATPEEAQAYAKERYEEVAKGCRGERLDNR